jgi:hypothetical protein
MKENGRKKDWIQRERGPGERGVHFLHENSIYDIWHRL